MRKEPEAIYPKEFFATFRPVKPKTCFVLMPFRRRFDKVYAVIREACELEAFECKRADEIPNPGVIPVQIMDGIQRAAAVMVDLTDFNPNVFYELGMSHVKKDRDQVILLMRDLKSAPFDVQHFRYVEYKNTPVGRDELRRKLREVLQTFPPPHRPLKIDHPIKLWAR